MSEQPGNTATGDAPAGTGSATVVISRVVKPGHEAEYEKLLGDFTRSAQLAPGYVGANFIRPVSKAHPEYVTVLRFASEEALTQWQGSQTWARLSAEVEKIAHGPASLQRVSGLEVWFTPKGVTAATAPSPHRMALVLFGVVYLLSLLLIPLFTRIAGNLPIYLRLVFSVGAQVLLMTYLIMPRVTRLLAKWLFRSFPAS